MKQYIAVIDSGVGGLDILNYFIENFPNESFLYIADNQNVPFGAKSKEQLEEIGKNIIKYIEKNNVKLIVIACNTLSVNAIDYMRKITNIPIYGIVRPTAKNLLNHSGIDSVLILATQATINTNRYYEYIVDFNDQIKIYQQPAPKLVDIIEANKIDEIDDVLIEYIKPYYDKIDAIILGCTHFPIVREHISKLFPNLVIFDSRMQMVQLLNTKLDYHNLRASKNDKQDIIIVASKSIEKLKDASSHFFDYKNKITKKELI